MTPAHCGSDGRPAAPGLRVLGAQWARAVHGLCPGSAPAPGAGCVGGRPEDALSSARQEGWENGGGERKEQMWVGRRCCLLIKCKCKADSTQTDLPNFWACSLGDAWRGTRRSFLRTGSALLAERTRDKSPGGCARG